MNENIEFLQAFLKNPGKVGSIRPSSPELARKMIEGIEPSAKNIVLELGVGTGAITKFLQQIVPDDKSYLGVEIDPDLTSLLKKGFDGMRIVQGNAVNARTIHERSGLGKVGWVISCLPFVSLPNEVGEKILEQIDEFMKDGCSFRTFQYAHGYYLPSAIKLREFMRNRYGRSQKSKLIMKNVPPAYTLTWSNRK